MKKNILVAIGIIIVLCILFITRSMCGPFNSFINYSKNILHRSQSNTLLCIKKARGEEGMILGSFGSTYQLIGKSDQDIFVMYTLHMKTGVLYPGNKPEKEHRTETTTIPKGTTVVRKFTSAGIPYLTYSFND